MSDELLGGLLLGLVIAPMVGLAAAALQPSRSTVLTAAVALGLLPALAGVAVVAVWAAGM